MKSFKLILALTFLTGTTISFTQAKTLESTKTPKKQAVKKDKVSNEEKKESKAVYKCEHCNYTSDKPGKCAGCGMELKKS